MTDVGTIAQLFEGWDKGMIQSFLQGHMGYALVSQEKTPAAAQIVVGDFCFFAGVPNVELIEKAAAPILVPRTAEWSRTIEQVWGERAVRWTRYTIKREPECFDRCRLNAYAASLPEGFEIRPVNREIYHRLMQEKWSRDLCSQFQDFDDYQKRGIGFAATYHGTPVSGASSYIVFDGGIEIEIDTAPDYRRQGLAKACGAKLILACLDMGLYPGWDAHDLRSVALAEKLGYHLDEPYSVYLLNAEALDNG